MAKKVAKKERKTVLVTGASAGIGAALAGVFAQKGHNLVLVARRKEKLDELAALLNEVYGAEVEVIAKDLLRPTAPKQIFEALSKKGKTIDILVNNAGVARMGKFQDTDPAEVSRMVQLNVVALTALTRLFLDGMIERGYGRILNVASIAAFQPIPKLAVYAATKAFVLSLTEAMSEELKGTGVRVTALCPGLTNTEMVDEVKPEEGILANIPSFLLMEPEQVAEEGYRVCMSGRAVHIPGLANQAGINWLRLQPRWFVRSLSGFFARAMR